MSSVARLARASSGLKVGAGLGCAVGVGEGADPGKGGGGAVGEGEARGVTEAYPGTIKFKLKRADSDSMIAENFPSSPESF